MKKITLLVTALLVCSTLCSASAPAEKKTKKHNRRQHFDWKKAEGERSKQRAKARQEHKAYVEALKKFHSRYIAEKDPAKKEAIRKELDSFLKQEFAKRIEQSKKRIVEMKKFVSYIEEQHNTFEAKSGEFIKKRTEEILNGKIIPQRRPPRQPKK